MVLAAYNNHTTGKIKQLDLQDTSREAGIQESNERNTKTGQK